MEVTRDNILSRSAFGRLGFQLREIREVAHGRLVVFSWRRSPPHDPVRDGDRASAHAGHGSPQPSPSCCPSPTRPEAGDRGRIALTGMVIALIIGIMLHGLAARRYRAG